MLVIAKSMSWVGIFMLLWVMSLGCRKKGFVRKNGASVLDGMWQIRQIVSVTRHLQALRFFLLSFPSGIVSCLVLCWISCDYLKCKGSLLQNQSINYTVDDAFSLLIITLGCHCILCNCHYLIHEKSTSL